MRLTTKGRYAVSAMLDLAYHSQTKSVTLTEIASRQIISLSYLEQLFANLRRAGMVKGVRGPGGGYTLCDNAKDINIAAIIKAVDERLDSTKCGGEANCHELHACLTHDLWVGLGEQIEIYLQNITLGDLLAKQLVQEVAQLQAEEAEQKLKLKSIPIQAQGNDLL